MTPPVPRSTEAAWVVLLAGWLAGDAAWSTFTRRDPLVQERESAPRDPTRASPRELRSWPGLGESRALAVARARWEHPQDGPRLYLSDVPGIGPGTEWAVRQWLEGAEAP